MSTDRRSSLSSDERARLSALRSATGLADLLELTDADTEREAYFAAKREWVGLRDRQLSPATPSDRLPGTHVDVDGRDVWVHGITHANTDAERAFLREHADRFLEAGDAVYCEQGVRPMYFEDVPDVYAMDDYRWALSNGGRRDVDATLSDASVPELRDVVDVGSVADEFRTATFSLLHAAEDVYGEELASALGDVASAFLTGREDAATGTDFESFTRSRRAAENPRLLGALQRYYRTRFLPQPVEREWLRRHDPQLEAVSHARNERMADYALFHADDADTVRIVVGAAHQPGVAYYLRRHRDGHRDLAGFELVE